MPQIANEILVIPVYNQEAELSEVTVLWREVVRLQCMTYSVMLLAHCLYPQPQSHISENCTFNHLIYTVVLVDSLGMIVDQNVVSSNNCRDSLCNITFSSFNSSLDYYISIRANNGIGQGSGNVTSVNIGKFVIK